MKQGLALLIALCLCVVSADGRAADVAVIFDNGGKFDKGFLESAFRSVIRARQDFGLQVEEVVRGDDETHQAVVSRAAEAADMVLLIGFSYQDAARQIAPTEPDTSFTLIDAVGSGPNIRSVSFREHEGAFLIGALAARKSRTGQVGFIGGIPVPVIKRFEAGFRQGVAFEDALVEVETVYIGSDGSAFQNPYAGYRAALGLIDNEADVLFAAAGATGLGVYQAAADRNVFAVGVDTSQNYLHPGTLLTSMLKRVDSAVYAVLSDWSDGSWQAGVETMGIAEGGVGYAFDRFNETLIPADLKAHLDGLAARIARGDITVEEGL